MKKSSIPNPDVSVFIKVLDRGFKLSVPADQERYYREGFDAFKKRVEQHRENTKGYDEIEATGLTAIECMVAMQRILEEMENLTNAFQERVARLEEKVSEAIES